MRFRELIESVLTVFHASTEQIVAFDKGKTRDGAFHFGSEAQARSRAISNKAPHVGRYQIVLNNPTRIRDDGGFWGPKIDRAKSSGHDGIVYLNRYENVTPEQLAEARAKGKGDERNLTDSQFLRIAPQAEDSYIVFEPEQIKPT